MSYPCRANGGCQANFYIINSIKDTNQLYKIGVC
jgi:hypothetical protein